MHSIKDLYSLYIKASNQPANNNNNNQKNPQTPRKTQTKQKTKPPSIINSSLF